MKINWDNIDVAFFGQVSEEMQRIINDAVTPILTPLSMALLVGETPGVAEDVFYSREECPELVKELEEKYAEMGFKKVPTGFFDDFEIVPISPIDDKYIDSLSKFILRASQPVLKFEAVSVKSTRADLIAEFLKVLHNHTESTYGNPIFDAEALHLDITFSGEYLSDEEEVIIGWHADSRQYKVNPY